MLGRSGGRVPLPAPYLFLSKFVGRLYTPTSASLRESREKKLILRHWLIRSGKEFTPQKSLGCSAESI